jgi:hypothetical protein
MRKNVWKVLAYYPRSLGNPVVTCTTESYEIAMSLAAFFTKLGYEATVVNPVGTHKAKL